MLDLQMFLMTLAAFDANRNLYQQPRQKDSYLRQAPIVILLSVLRRPFHEYLQQSVNRYTKGQKRHPLF